jgi:2-phospho-L-lactate guanylyltransferase
VTHALAPARVTALIPVKSLAYGKSRLARTLDLDHRIQLTEETLRRLLHILRANEDVVDIAVVTRDPEVAEWCDVRKVRVLSETGEGLNAALTEARAQLPDAAALLVLPADLAAIAAQDLGALIALSDGQDGPCVVIAPDRHRQGTNALMIRPPGMIEFAFGPNSAARHAALAEAANCAVCWYHSDSISLDLDLPDDYELYSRQW